MIRKIKHEHPTQEPLPGNVVPGEFIDEVEHKLENQKF